MKIGVQFYAHLRDFTGVEHLDLEVEESASVAGLLQNLYRKFPSLREHDKTILVGAGVEFVDRSYKLRPGDQIAIMPPVQGG